ncbi:mycofactocin system FadH/OYE family oxidoreductase 1 [Rhodococcus sp. H36-A4]|uniref:mycofactocin system FadH/OYE family oxidoreductase 1 n=1 Tax=Rhodococcus sp. H36-A4 TaxID=3004353 RepID=UPI0022B05799|nr:mycofactocin system FadH/OYE family oxidoreductase 1 [Rhodococcus sp. H36-A4]MCZ4076335.1 mycofactocin system FadH/OYE family oxidoreductase 1 [Rhodococcus sp. H36-A4]
MTLLTEPIVLGGRSAASRVMFGPHATNLADGRAFSPELVEYYRRRAGVGIIVTENASVHRSDWPYERAPLASECGPGWQAVVDACRPNGTLVLAGLTHTGSQGSTAYSREALWGPSHVADVASRELPMAMEPEHIRAAVDGFAAAARVAVDADVDGVELDAGPSSLIRQFLSGLTNLREDEFGTDRMLFVRNVIAVVRAELGPDRILALRLSCDEGAPWAGITPAIGADIAREIAPDLDLLTVVRGGAMDMSSYRPDFHTEPGFNRDLCRSVSDSVDAVVPVVLQGSIVDTVMADAALSEGVADIVEMTRALIADPDLVSKSRAGASPRPCILCNQSCLVRDPRNPTVACIGRAGDDPEPDGAGKVLVVGGGPAGLEAARVLALRGRTVTLYERKPVVGGLFSLTSIGEALTDWLAAECVHLGVDIVTGIEIEPSDLEAEKDVVLATGSVPSPRSFEVAPGVHYLDSGAVLGGAALDEGPVVVWDPVGGPVAVALAERFAQDGKDVSVVTVDQTIGRHLSLSGDLAPANVRLQRAGVQRHLLSRILRVGDGGAEVEDIHTGQRRKIECAVVVDCSHRSADDSLYGPRRVTIGDCVAPRSAAEAIRDGYDAGVQKPTVSAR